MRLRLLSNLKEIINPQSISKKEQKEETQSYLETLRDRNYSNILERDVQTSPKAFDICLGAMWDHPKDSAWMEKQFSYINLFYKQAYISAWNYNAYKMRYYQSGDVKELHNAAPHKRKSNRLLAEAYKRVRNFEVNVLRAENDQSCEVEPIKVCIKEDLITNFGLGIIIENFMVFNNLRFDTMETGIGNSEPFGGEKGLEAAVHSVSITQEGYAIPYGIEARHGAPFLASQTTNNVAEIGIKDSLSTRLYSRSVFPEDRIIDHVKDFDAYSINHITLMKAF